MPYGIVTKTTRWKQGRQEEKCATLRGVKNIPTRNQKGKGGVVQNYNCPSWVTGNKRMEKGRLSQITRNTSRRKGLEMKQKETAEKTGVNPSVGGL